MAEGRWELTLDADRTIVPFCQPIMDLKTGKVRAFEALARRSHPALGLVPATVFVPLAEESGLISELSDELLRAACSDAMAWPTHVGLRSTCRRRCCGI